MPFSLTKLFPTVLIVLDIAAAVVYAYNKQWGHVLYWASAGLITLAVTFLMK